MDWMDIILVGVACIVGPGIFIGLMAAQGAPPGFDSNHDYGRYAGLLRKPTDKWSHDDMLFFEKTRDRMRSIMKGM